MKKINIIVAKSKNNIIGFNNKLPWNFKSDLIYFNRLTTGLYNKNAIIMGYNTYLSLNKKQLKNRMNIVIDKKMNLKNDYYISNIKNLIFTKNLESSIKYCNNNNKIDNIFIIGGSKIYKEAFKKIDIDKLYLTEINENYLGNSNLEYNEIRKIKKVTCEKSKINCNYICKHSYFKENIRCKVIAKPGAKIICQTPESDGNNFTNINDSFCQELAMDISEKMKLTAQLGNTLEEKIDKSVISKIK